MKNNFKIKIIVVAVFLFSFIVFLAITSIDKNQRINLALNSQVDELNKNFLLTIDYFHRDAEILQSNISNNSQVQKILYTAQKANATQKAILRKELYTLLTPLYINAKRRGIEEIQIVFPNNKTFLRMHNKDKFDDDLTNIRYSCDLVNTNKKTIKGFEKGKSSHAFRYVFPMFNTNKSYLAAIDISLSSSTIQKKLIKVNKLHTHFLVGKKLFDSNIIVNNKTKATYIQSIESFEYLFTLVEHKDKTHLERGKKILLSLKEEIHSKISKKKAFAVYSNFENSTKVIAFLPIFNIKHKKVVAYLVSYTDNANINNILFDYNMIVLVVFFGMLFLSYFIYKNLINKEDLTIEVKNKTKVLQKVTEDLQNLNNSLEERIINEVNKSKEIENKLFQSEKLAGMGEMIGNIAHQWRQPLSVISTIATGTKLQKEMGMLKDNVFIENMDLLNENAQYLSDTIDDFKNFIKGERKMEVFSLIEKINGFIHLVEGSAKSSNISFILDIDDIKIETYSNELVQCLINIFNNAKDALLASQNEDRYIFISTSQNDKNLQIIIKDNAGGIPEKILPKIFDPYFTTKYKTQGTGLGLHMTYNLIKNGMKGKIEASNEEFEYNNKKFIGAVFTITIPL